MTWGLVCNIRGPYTPFPAGMIMPSVGLTVPPGYLICRGGIVEQGDYPELFTAIGTRFNVGGEGETQFRLPDMRDRFLAGIYPVYSEFDCEAIGDVGGAVEHNHAVAGNVGDTAITEAQMPSHRHNAAYDTVRAQASGYSGYSRWGTGASRHIPADDPITTFTGGSKAHNHNQGSLATQDVAGVPPWLGVDYLITTGASAPE
jgi:microcystin-dependent protein